MSLKAAEYSIYLGNLNMAESVLSVCWKDHTSELSTVYKSLLENNFLVDCTISAEGQNLKAHRLVLSASSPYLHKLFSEETAKHPFVILLDASFETLKAVIDFVYRGEAQIPEGNLKQFLTLAQSLQIKGLNAFTQDYENKNLSSSSIGNVSQDPPERNQVTCEVQGINASQVGSHVNNSRKHPDRFDGYSEAVPANSSVPLKGYSALCDKVKSTSVMTPLQVQGRQDGCDDVSTGMEITVKKEPVYSAFLEARNENLDNVNSNEPISRNFTSNMDGRTSSVCGEEDVNLFSSYSESSNGNTEPSELTSSQQQPMQLGDQMSSDQDVAEESETLLPVPVPMPKGEQLTDEESDEPMDYPAESVKDTNEKVEQSGTARCEQNLDQCFRAEVLPPENDLATPQRSGVRLWGPGRQEESTTPLAHLELQLREGQGEEPVLSAKRRKALTPSSSLASHSFTHSKERPFMCEVCGASFTCPSHLIIHNRTHTGERPYSCNICGVSFSKHSNLVAHSRTHTGERPFSCEVCGVSFTRRRSLIAHNRSHTGERPFGCDVCGVSFTQRSHLVAHSRTHTGERPYHCDVCGKRFAESGTLSKHYRTHSGERPYICDICGKCFTSSTGLIHHKRRHVEKGE